MGAVFVADAGAGDAAPVGRLAPSPTGLLHVGHARSFLAAWWSVRARGGTVLLRLEDLDAERTQPGMVEQMLADLAWLGLDWDGEPIVQARDVAHHTAALERLVAASRAYPCVCTRKEIQLARSAPHADDQRTAYPGTCRDRFASIEQAEAESGRPAALRLRVAPGTIGVADGFAGLFAENVAETVGDFPIARKGGEAAYQLAVVVDDARQGVTEVLRGDDLLPSTLQQVLVQRALDLPHPRWIHLPLVVDDDGRRLAKRCDDLALAALRARGVQPQALVGWIARSLGIDVSGAARAAELSSAFAPLCVPRRPVVFGAQALSELGP